MVELEVIGIVMQPPSEDEPQLLTSRRIARPLAAQVDRYRTATLTTPPTLHRVEPVLPAVMA